MKYYDIRDTLRGYPNAHYYVVYGERSNGKTYSSLDYALDNFIKNGEQFAQDEIGTPFCVTYDFESETDNMVTVRFRDTMEQVRVSIDELDAFFADKFDF